MRRAAATVVVGSAAAALWALSASADTGPEKPHVVVRPVPVVHPSTATAFSVATASSAASGSLGHAIGAKIMSGMDGTYPSRSLLARVRKGEVGGVILFGANISSHLPGAIAALQHAAAQAGDPPLVIATDQEGGDVRRLPNAPPFQSPATMSGNIDHQGRITAQALHAVRINTNLAPVADVLHAGSFIGSRSFGTNPAAVADKACQFAVGLQSAGVNATFKHFPGLGDAMTNTDLGATTVHASPGMLLRDLQPYRQCQPRLVMVSNASYPALGSHTPAVFSHGIVTGLLRNRLGFHGVTISDTLEAPEVAGPDAAVRATEAGVDMLLYTDESGAVEAYAQLTKAVANHVVAGAAVRDSATRIYALTTNPGGG